MKTNIAKLTLIAALGFSVAGTSYAHEDYSEGQSLHWLSHVSESKSQPTTNQLAPYGYATSSAAARVVNIDSGTKYLNVTPRNHPDQCWQQERHLDVRYPGHCVVSACQGYSGG